MTKKGEWPCIAIIFIGQQIVTRVSGKKLAEALLAFLGMFYLLDVDYPTTHEVGLTMLQNLLFADHCAPQDMSAAFNATLSEYMKYKKCME